MDVVHDVAGTRVGCQPAMAHDAALWETRGARSVPHVGNSRRRRDDIIAGHEVTRALRTLLRTLLAIKYKLPGTVSKRFKVKDLNA